MSALQSIVYVSTATRLLTVAELESLLIEARDLNVQNGVTGVLLYCDGNFMQCFEGPETSMQETYQRIRDSQKHKGIIELLNERIDVRSFPGWQMGFTQPTKSALLALSTAGWDSVRRGSHGATNKSPGLVLLEAFWSRVKK